MFSACSVPILDGSGRAGRRGGVQRVLFGPSTAQPDASKESAAQLEASREKCLPNRRSGVAVMNTFIDPCNYCMENPHLANLNEFIHYMAFCPFPQ